MGISAHSGSENDIAERDKEVMPATELFLSLLSTTPPYVLRNRSGNSRL